MAEEWAENPGYQPEETIGKRVTVRLANGRVSGDLPVNSDSLPGWKADNARWEKGGDPWDITHFRVR